MAKLTCLECGKVHVPLWPCPNVKPKGGDAADTGHKSVSKPVVQPVTADVPAPADTHMIEVKGNTEAFMRYLREPQKFDRTAYQREYMRQWRQKRKEPK